MASRQSIDSASPGPVIEANNRCPCSCTSTPNPRNCELQLGSHQYDDLAQKIGRYAHRRRGSASYHPRQAKAYSEANQCPRQTVSWHLSNDRSISGLRKWARIFDDLFFFGALHHEDRCQVSWRPGLVRDEKKLGKTKTWSECYRHQQIHRVHIWIEPNPCQASFALRSDHSESIIRTLLHELCHAALMLYGCKSTDARTHTMCNGLTGHGTSFFALFEHVLSAAERNLDVQAIDRHEAFFISKESERKALEKALSRVGMTPSDVPRMDLADLEEAIGESKGSELFWKPRPLSQTPDDGEISSPEHDP